MSKASLDLSLYLIVGPTHVDGDPTALIQAAIAGGVTLVQVRDKRPSTAEQIAYATVVRDALTGSRVPLLINDRVDVALAVGADGIHVGREDMDPVTARRLLGPDAIIGVTIKTQEEAAAADPVVIDYGSIGGVFPTESKHNPDPPIGLDGLTARVGTIMAVAPDMPICAIAGIDQVRAQQVMEAGLDGVCVVSAITHSDDPEAAAAEIRAVVDTVKQQRSQLEETDA